MPSQAGQLWAMALAAGRQLGWGRRGASREVRVWRDRARAIPDAPTREDALASIAQKRAHAEGAALFWTLAHKRHPGLLRLLVAYQTAWDFLDNASERGAGAGAVGEGAVGVGAVGADVRAGGGQANGRLLHRALVEALDPSARVSDHYRLHCHRDDGGYLRALVGAGRERCAALASYERVRCEVLLQAERCAVQGINHDPEPVRRELALRAWAEAESTEAEPIEAESIEEEPVVGGELRWFERSAAASASLVPHVLLALAAERECEACEVAAACGAYLPWVSLATAMLDSYADRVEDAESGDHSYISYYGDFEEAVGRLEEIVERALREVGALRAGSRHAVLVAGVVAMYTSKDSARSAAMRASTRRVLGSGGRLCRLLGPVLRGWRILNGLRAV